MNYRQEYNESTCITKEGRYQRGRGGIKTTFLANLGFRNPSATFEVATRGIFHHHHRILSQHLRRLDIQAPSSSRSLAALRYFHVLDKQRGC